MLREPSRIETLSLSVDKILLFRSLKMPCHALLEYSAQCSSDILQFDFNYQKDPRRRMCMA